MADRTVMQLQQIFNEIITEHRPGTLDGERATILKICNDCYCQGIEDARTIMQETFGDAPVAETKSGSLETSENLHNPPAVPLDPLERN